MKDFLTCMSIDTTICSIDGNYFILNYGITNGFTWLFNYAEWISSRDIFCPISHAIRIVRHGIFSKIIVVIIVLFKFPIWNCAHFLASSSFVPYLSCQQFSWLTHFIAVLSWHDRNNKYRWHPLIFIPILWYGTQFSVICKYN